MPRRAHLIGSVPLQDAGSVFATVTDILGSFCRRIPDGETGERGYWIRWQNGTFANCPGLEAVAVTQSLPGFKDAVKRTFYRIKPGVDPASIIFGELGYTREALASYAIFSQMTAEGKISPETRFLVALPTPVALLSGFVTIESRTDVEPAIERAIFEDVARLQDGIPHDRLSIQLDVCYEVVGNDGGPPLHYGDAVAGSAERIGRLCGSVDSDVEIGIHLCYGDPGHQHIVQPTHLGTCVSFANAICLASRRRIDFMHMPVPRERGDDAYFEPLRRLKMPSETHLVLGLVHYTDGIDGTRARMAVADRFVADYDVASECGFGRRDPSTIEHLLRVHRAVCA